MLGVQIELISIHFYRLSWTIRTPISVSSTGRTLVTSRWGHQCHPACQFRLKRVAPQQWAVLAASKKFSRLWGTTWAQVSRTWDATCRNQCLQRSVTQSCPHMWFIHSHSWRLRTARVLVTCSLSSTWATASSRRKCRTTLASSTSLSRRCSLFSRLAWATNPSLGKWISINRTQWTSLSLMTETWRRRWARKAKTTRATSLCSDAYLSRDLMRIKII